MGQHWIKIWLFQQLVILQDDLLERLPLQPVRRVSSSEMWRFQRGKTAARRPDDMSRAAPAPQRRWSERRLAAAARTMREPAGAGRPAAPAISSTQRPPPKPSRTDFRLLTCYVFKFINLFFYNITSTINLIYYFIILLNMVIFISWYSIWVYFLISSISLLNFLNIRNKVIITMLMSLLIITPGHILISWFFSSLWIKFCFGHIHKGDSKML